MTTATIQHLNFLIDEVGRNNDRMGAALLPQQNLIRHIYQSLRNPADTIDGQLHSERMDDWELDLAAQLLWIFDSTLLQQSKDKQVNSGHVTKALREMESTLQRISGGQAGFLPQVESSYQLALAAAEGTVTAMASQRIFLKALIQVHYGKGNGKGFA